MPVSDLLQLWSEPPHEFGLHVAVAVAQSVHPTIPVFGRHVRLQRRLPACGMVMTGLPFRSSSGQKSLSSFNSGVRSAKMFARGPLFVKKLAFFGRLSAAAAMTSQTTGNPRTKGNIMRAGPSSLIHPKVESLEGRCLPATMFLNSGVLRVTGTEFSDVIRINYSGHHIAVQGAGQVDAWKVTSVAVDARGGNDLIDVSALQVRTLVYAGADNDTVYGSAMSDAIHGEG